MPSKNKFEVNGNTIKISRDGWDALVFATYREDYYKELSTHVWSLNKGYPYNATLGGGLHRYMMAKWYGEDVLRDFTDRGYVVDHMNNDHMNCCITNLEFLKKGIMQSLNVMDNTILLSEMGVFFLMPSIMMKDGSHQRSSKNIGVEHMPPSNTIIAHRV